MSPRSASRDADELRLETSEDGRKRKMKEIDRTRTSRRPEYAIDSNGTHYYVRVAVTNTFLRRFSLNQHVKRKVRYDVSEAARRLYRSVWAVCWQQHQEHILGYGFWLVRSVGVHVYWGS